MSPRVIAGYVAMVLIWGTTWAAIKVGVALVPPFTFALERAIAVTALLGGAALLLRLPFPRRPRVIAAAAVAGVFNTGLSWALIFWAEQFVPSGLVAVFGATGPVWTAFLAHFLVRGDRLSFAKLFALALGLVGTAVLVGSPGSGGGEQAVLATVLLGLMPLTWAVSAILASRYLSAESPVPVIAIEAAAGALVLIPFALTELGRPAEWSRDVVAAFLYLVVLGSGVGLSVNLWLYRKLRPTTIMLSQILIPVQAVAIGVLALGEEFTARMIVGAALVLGAVALNAYAGSGAARRVPVPEGPVATPAD